MKTSIKDCKLKGKKGDVNGVKKMDMRWRQKGEEDTGNSEQGKENERERKRDNYFSIWMRPPISLSLSLEISESESEVKSLSRV